VAKQCQGLAQGIERELPELAQRKAPTELRTAAAYVRSQDAILLTQLPASAPRWAGLWVLPFAELSATEKPELGSARALGELGLKSRSAALLREARHTITRFRITLSVVSHTLANPKHAAATLFTKSEVERLALPSVHAKLVKALW
jgi:adenine-specific DNA glycosylase